MENKHETMRTINAFDVFGAIGAEAAASKEVFDFLHKVTEKNEDPVAKKIRESMRGNGATFGALERMLEDAKFRKDDELVKRLSALLQDLDEEASPKTVPGLGGDP